MTKEELIKKGKILAVVLIVIFIIWFLVINPVVKFKSNERTMEEAGKRYFEVNSSMLPTGTRIKTIYLKELYSSSFLEDDFYVPFTKKACSVTDSFIKVKQVNGEYKYYTYLNCGFLKSKIDHEGPEIILNGKESITVDKGDEYKELGVAKVTDKTDGTINPSKVKIVDKNVNTNETGTYKVTYEISDSFNNKTIKTRTVKVVEKLKNVVKKNTNNEGVYKGLNPNNYIYFSNMLFRIVEVENGNVKIVSDQDISNVDYNGIDKWLDYYYNHLTEKSKTLIAKNKYCNMKIDESSSNTTTCSNKTEDKLVYIPSIIEVNKTKNENNQTYMKPKTMSWLSNKNGDKKAYLTRNAFYGEYSGREFMIYSIEDTYGVRPMITIKGNSLITSGDGTKNNPYTLGDTKRGKAKDLLNTRNTGEYFKYSGYLFRIIETEKDGTTKVISEDNIKSDGESVLTYYAGKTNIYNPKEKGNIGYYIENKMSEFINLSYFVKKEITVPIYKDKIIYNKEVSSKKYTVKVSAPNSYDMFSAFVYGENKEMQSYWLINSSKEERAAAITDIGVFTNDKDWIYSDFGIRIVGYMNKDISIVRGKGTKNEPYILSK